MMKSLLQLSEEDIALLKLMCSAIDVSPEEMAVALDFNVVDFVLEFKTEGSVINRIAQAELIKRKTKILNSILDCAERDSPEAQKIALKLFDKYEMNQF